MPDLRRLRNWISDRDPRADGPSAESVFLVGLGRFGTAVAKTLVQLDIEVMAVDIDAELVNRWANQLTHVRQADSTSAATLKQLGAANFDAAVVAIGTGIEASILTTAALADLGVRNIWAKALTTEHGSILQRVGAHHVVFPEKQMGERVAHIVTGQVVDYIQLDEGFVLAEIEVPDELIGQRLSETDLRQRFAVTVVCVKPEGGSFTYATADTLLNAGDLLVIAGATSDAERFTKFAGK